MLDPFGADLQDVAIGTELCQLLYNMVPLSDVNSAAKLRELAVAPNMYCSTR